MKKNRNKLYKDAGARIQELRCERNYTRSMVAEKVEISEKFLYEIETGRKGFSTETLYRLSDLFGVTCDYILCGRRRRGKANAELMALVEKLDRKDSLKMIQIIRIMGEAKK